MMTVKFKVSILLTAAALCVLYTNCSKLESLSEIPGAANSSSSEQPPSGSGPFVEGPHPNFPIMGTKGGRVLQNVVVIPIYYSTDTNEPTIQDYLQKYVSSGLALSQVAEYGAQSITLGSAINIQKAPPAYVTEIQMKADALPLLPSLPADAFLLFIGPAGIPSSFSAAHYVWNAGTSSNVAFAVIPASTNMHNVTYDISHELTEAVTDFDGFSSYRGLDFPYFYAHSSDEVADLCDDSSEAVWGANPAGLEYRVARTWSNAAARAGRDPCIPVDTRRPGPYYNTAPAYDQIQASAQDTYPGGQKLIRIPVGSTRVIPLNLFSTGPTSGPWTVDVVSDGFKSQNFSSLQVSLDKNQGANGDVINMTVTVLNAPSDIPFEQFTLRSTLNGQVNFWEVAIGN